jgi:hypothetical protein
MPIIPGSITPISDTNSALRIFIVKLVKVNVGKQGANHCPLRTA